MEDHEANAALAAQKAGEEERPLSIEDRRRLFGEKLRATREGLGQSDKDVIHLTRISPPFITALEEGRFEALPGEVFGRGFIKNICKALEVDSASLLADYDSCWEVKGPKSKSYLSPKRATKTRLRKERSATGLKFVNYFSLRAVSLWIGLPVAFLASIIALMFKLPLFSPSSSPLPTLDQKKADVAVVEQTEGGASESALAVGGENPEPSLAAEKMPEASALGGKAEPTTVAPPPATQSATQSAKGKEAQPQLTLVNASASETSRLLVRVTDKVEVKYKFDDKPAETQVHEAGVYEFAFKDKADIYIFDIAKVDIEFNGRKIGWYGPQLGEKRLSFVGKDPKQDSL